MGRAQGASALHELLKSPQIEYKCELMKTGLFFSLFGVKGTVLGLIFKGTQKPSKLHLHIHWNHS